MIALPSFDAPLADHPLAVRLDRSGPADFADEPLYPPLCRLIARSPGLLALLDAAPPTQRLPNLILAALHHQVLRAGSKDGLGGWYASAGGTRSPDDPALPAALAAFANRHAEALQQLIATRRTQTNEVGRCAVLKPALDEIARHHGPQLALFDFGCSAGLNLAVDRYRYDYRGDASGGLPCRVVGAAPEALAAPPAWTLAARCGVDQATIDVQDDDALRWLMACLWPSDAPRRERLAMAVAETRALRPAVIQAEDGLAVLETWLDELPAGVVPVLFNSWVLFYFAPADLAAHVARVRRLVQQRGLLWLSAEGAAHNQPLAPELQLPTTPVPGEPGASPGNQTFWLLTEPGDGAPRTRLLARSHPHGAWLAWRA